MTSTPEPDARLIDARDLALAALHEITAPATVGPAAGYTAEEDGSVSLRFENRLPGYPGWYWTVTVARIDDEEPTVLEVELLPGEGALLAPDWVPWAERLAEYRAHQAELAEQAAAEATAAVDGDDSEEDVDSEEDDESDDDGLDSDDDDFDGDVDEAEEVDEADVTPRLHAGDIDGVDIDELDDSVEESEDEVDESDDDDDSEDDESEDADSDDDAADSDEEE